MSGVGVGGSGQPGVGVGAGSAGAASLEFFPAGCVEALKKAEIRAAADQQLEAFVHRECDADTKRLCTKELAMDEVGTQ